MSLRSRWFDAEGNECDPSVADSGEIAELDDEGVELQRTYLEKTGGGSSNPRLDPTSELTAEDQDTLKFGTWDMHTVEDGIWSTVTTLDQLFTALGIQELGVQERRMAVGDFLGLPAWTPAPEELKTETYAWLEATRP